MNFRKSILSFLIVFCLGFSSSFAKEGMRIPSLIKNFLSQMQADGLKLSAEDIYSVNKSSLKDAIVHFGGGCTAEVVSQQGLILTNHHCGFSQIQSHSSLENDYLKNGFWAKDHASELANPGLTATFIVRIEDVTQKVLDGVGDSEEPGKRAAVINERMKSIEKQVMDAEPGHEAKIKAYYYGNEYYMVVTKTYRDVRLVGAPPSSVGKYGGDTDNWMWPRHTGDFSVFRIYAGPDNEPAEYSPENKPYKPGHSFPVNIGGTKPGDFTMVYGFPGRTQQYLHSRAVEYITQKMNPAAIDMREASLEIIDEAMASSDEIRIQYAAKQARISNAYKKWIGENRGLERLKAIAKKQKLESDYKISAMRDRNLAKMYSRAVGSLKAHYDEGEKLMSARSMFIEFAYVGPEFMRHAGNSSRLIKQYDEFEKEGKVDAEVERLKKAAAGFFKNYQSKVDEQVLAALYGKYIDGLDPDFRPDIHTELQSKYKGDWAAMAADIFEDSYYVNESREMAMWNKFSGKTIKKLKSDMAYRMISSVQAAYFDKVAARYSQWQAELEDMMRIYVKGMMILFPDKDYWPDANSTLRIAWGKVEGSEPRDGVVYNPYTTLDGVLAKYVPGDREFDLPAKLIQLAKNHDYGRYGYDGELPVCFTASNHTTGGNSGSPVIDGNGYLIGINFDRSWESTMSDIMYDPEYCRNIVVDIRYVLFIIDKYAGATHLIDEMKLIN